MERFLRLAALPVAALMLMSFDFQNEETEWLLMPDEEMFGDDGTSPNIDAIKAKALEAMGCTNGLNAENLPGLIASKCPDPFTGTLISVSRFTVYVIRLSPTRERYLPGYSCSKRQFRELEGDGIGYIQTCGVKGYLQEVQVSFYFGVEI